MPEKSPKEPESLPVNFMRIAEKSQEVLAMFLEKQEHLTEMSIDWKPVTAAFNDMLIQISQHPENTMKALSDLYQESMILWANTTVRMLGKPIAPAFTPDPKDRRFHDEEWQENVVFDFIKQSYLMTSQWLHEVIEDVQGLEDDKARMVEFYTRQFINAISPTNFVLTNPQVLRKTFETQGENLVDGLENLLQDLRESEGVFRIATANKKAFVLGKDIATTPGKVIFQNDLMQLIQYEPMTKQVYQRPLFIVAPWINKYYVLDMRPENSFVRWLVKQGHTVFVTSWVNPDKKLKNKDFEDYLQEGILQGLDVIEQATGERQVNVIGYCIGGTLLAAALAYLQRKGGWDRVVSATFLTTLIDFAQAGELRIFSTDEQIDAMEDAIQKKGYFNGADMSFIFSLLRSNELIWSFAINNYLLGKELLPFDLLFWNADNTRLPAKMHLYYLRNMYVENNLCKPDALTLLDQKIDISKIETPSYFLSTREDHIAPWKATYAATQLFKGPLRFVLSASGHIAGVVNPASSNKYDYWANDKVIKTYPQSPERWLVSAKEYKQSWWHDWQEWITSHGYSGNKVKARQVGEGALPVIEPAPGSYVCKRS